MAIKEVMGHLSPVQIAKIYSDKLSSCSEDVEFSLLREVYQQLKSVPGGDVDPLSAAGGMLAANLIGDILEDVTRAVPWDDSGDLKAVRKAVLSLSKDALLCLSKFAPNENNSRDYFEKIGKLLSTYETILNSLDDNDRKQLQKDSGGGVNHE